MKAVTLRNIPKEVAKVIRAKADKDGKSVNKTILELLETAAGLKRPGQKKILHHDLDHLAGTWTREEAEAFEKHLWTQRSIDEDMWK